MSLLKAEEVWYKWRIERIVAEGKGMNKWACKEENPILHHHLKRGSEKKMILSLSSIITDA